MTMNGTLALAYSRCFFFHLFLSKANGVRNKLLFSVVLLFKNQHILQEAR